MEGRRPAATLVPLHPLNTALAQLRRVKPPSRDGSCFPKNTQRRGLRPGNRGQSRILTRVLLAEAPTQGVTLRKPLKSCSDLRPGLPPRR